MFLVSSKFNNLMRTSFCIFRVKNYSTIQNEPKTIITEEANQFKDRLINTKLKAKLPARQPLAKNFFLGNVDKDLLGFPEVISRDEISSLYNEIKNVEFFFQNISNKCGDKISVELLNNFKNLELFGLNIPQIYGGKEYSWSETLIASQFEIDKTNIASLMLPHRSICDIINVHGTEQQKQKYLRKLSDGSLIGADAILESNNENNFFFNTIAEYDSTNEMWTLSGEKIILNTGSKIDVLLVLAETQKLDCSGNDSKGITLFIIDTKLPGVKIDESTNHFSHTSAVFQNVNISNANIIGQPNEGSEVAQLLLQNSRIRSSYVGFGIMKSLINKTTKHIIETKHCGISLKDMESVTTYLSKILCNSYAVESMVYYTTGLMDEFENQDIDLETAIVKLFTLNSLWSSAISVMDFMGSKFLLDEQDGKNDIQNILQLYTYGETVDSLRLFIALTGLKHTGISINEEIKKQRNPTFNPGYILKKYFQTSKIEFPKAKMSLHEELHPSLAASSLQLEHSICRLCSCTEILLARYGNEITTKHSEIKRLAEIVTLIYASFASLSRSSRSYCIGLKLADYEMLIASSITLSAHDRIKELSFEIEHGPYITNDNYYQNISKQLLKSKGYFSENPLKYNY